MPFTASLRRAVDGPPGLAWSTLCKRSLDLHDTPAALRLWSRLPLKIGFPASDSRGRAVLARRLAEAGVEATFEAVTTRDDLCPRHPHLIADRLCPRYAQRPVCALCVDVEPVIGCHSCARWTRLRRAVRRGRIAVLLALLAIVAAGTLWSRHRIASWRSTLAVDIVVLAAEPLPVVERYVAALAEPDYQALERFMQQQSERHGLRLASTVRLTVSQGGRELPPARPSPDAPWYEVAWWSLWLRWWSARVALAQRLPACDVRLYALYHEYRPGRELAQSLGLEQGHLGIVFLFADPESAALSQVLLAHELFHAIGASDTYGPDGRPRYPEGYADPQRQPRLPQVQAELMAGSIPLTTTAQRLPAGLHECVVGPTAAREVGWLD